MPDQITLSYFIIWRVWKEPAVLCSLYCNNTCAILAMLALPCVHTWDCMCVRACVNECVCTHLLETYSAVPCLAAIVLVIVYHFLPIFLCFSFPFLLYFAFSLFFFFFFLYLLPVLLALVPNAPPTSVTSRLALSNPISCWWRGWMRRW